LLILWFLSDAAEASIEATRASLVPLNRASQTVGLKKERCPSGETAGGHEGPPARETLYCNAMRHDTAGPV